jgi:two-component system cell cycle response regulator
MKKEFTREEAQNLIDCAKEEFSVVRVVEPVDQKVMDLKTMEAEPVLCSHLWGRCERCENCTSNRALFTKDTAIKIEIIDDKTYLVISKFMKVEGKEFVLEMVYNATSEFMLEASQKGIISRMIKGYNHLLVTDPLTGIFNRRFLDEDFVPSLKCCHEQGVVVNVALMDIDKFKQINDRFGHQAGDSLLRDISGFWKKNFDSREKFHEKIVVRYGGDELLVIESGVEPDEFQKAMRAYYKDMRKICYLSGGESVPFSISFGFASSREIGSCWEWDKVLGLADQRMYEEKERVK